MQEPQDQLEGERSALEPTLERWLEWPNLGILGYIAAVLAAFFVGKEAEDRPV